ncbi:MAG TPA: hypothetical protein VGK94_07850 [Candidatus Polarisedimenticolia bacterium]|jgi:hypothetical protein
MPDQKCTGKPLDLNHIRQLHAIRKRYLRLSGYARDMAATLENWIEAALRTPHISELSVGAIERLERELDTIEASTQKSCNESLAVLEMVLSMSKQPPGPPS